MKRMFTMLGLIAAPALLFGQSQRVVMLEHFTQASCGPCAMYNPRLNQILNANPNMIVSVKFQTSWPGVDPMNAQNPNEVAARVSYYGINSVPRSVIDGNYYNGNPASVTESTFSNRASVPSPMEVSVSQRFSNNGDSIYVRAAVKLTGSITGTHTLHLAVIERNIWFNTPPGSNGEKHFESVMKKMLPSSSGTTLPALQVGDSAVYTYAWKLANIYDMGQVASVAYVQNETNKEIHQAAYARPNFPLSMTLSTLNNIAAKIAGNNSQSSFPVNFTTANQSNDTYKFSINKSALPTGWDASFTINGQTYADSANVAIAALDSQQVVINITSGNNVNEKGAVTLTVHSTSRFTNYTITKKVTAYSNINTAYVHKQGSVNGFMNSFNAAGASVMQIADDDFKAMDSTSFNRSHIRHIFINSGVNYADVLTDPEITNLQNFLSSGGNMFIIGQDYGFSVSDPNSISSSLAKQFYANTIGANYLSDGTDAGLPIGPFPGEFIFGNMASTTLNTASYTLYSDHLSVSNQAPNARPAFVYSNNSNDIAGIRNFGPNWKTVYVGFIFEAISSSTFKNELLALSIQWFDGTLTAAEYDAQLAALMLKAYPNPASDQVAISLQNAPAKSKVEIIDVMGRTVQVVSVPEGNSTVQLNTSALQSGTYFYKIQGQPTQKSQQLVIIK